MSERYVDVLILGAGVSGIGAACHLRRNCPDKSFTVLEMRDDLGGTWDLFEYPGIRSDSDMFTFGYSFRPWTETETLASGDAIKNYVRETAEEYGVDEEIRYGRRAEKASWSTDKRLWTITAENTETGEIETYHARFIIECTGYYNYEHGHDVDFPQEETFQGTSFHPQNWPDDLDYSDKKVVIVGSGATSITLLPAMAKDARHVTMLQRSPTYILAMPSEDTITEWLRRYLPEWLVYRITRTRNIVLQRLVYDLAQTFPNFMRWLLQRQVRSWLGEDYDMRHFDPDYEPWDQRLCVVPDGDFFKAIRDGKASVVTDRIERFTEDGILLQDGRDIDDGRVLEADVIVEATGLELQMMGGIDIEIDGEEATASERMVYRGAMLENIPNAVTIFGYINASWTLKVDLVCEYTCRLLNYMDDNDYTMVVPTDDEGVEREGHAMDELKAGYIQRASDRLPPKGKQDPWKVTNNYFYDWLKLHYGSIDDGVLKFSGGFPSE
jgi:cation diffusion facilitator CzcD-associated flavoprotein CzcO